MYWVLLYAACYVFAVVPVEEHSGFAIVAHAQLIGAGTVLFRDALLGLQIELLRAIVDDRLSRRCFILPLCRPCCDHGRAKSA